MHQLFEAKAKRLFGQVERLRLGPGTAHLAQVPKTNPSVSDFLVPLVETAQRDTQASDAPYSRR